MRLFRRFTSLGTVFLLVGACANGTTTTSSPAQPASPTAVIPASTPPSAQPATSSAVIPASAPPSAQPATSSAVIPSVPAQPATSSAVIPANPSVPARASKPLLIHIRNYAYTPAAPVVVVGQPVEIVNDDNVAHTWSAAPKAGWSYTSGNLEKGQRASFPGFAKPGAYQFVCYYHAEMPSMTGVMTVTKGT